MIPALLQSPFFDIGCTGPGAPLGGTAPGGTVGWLTARAEGQTDSATTKVAATQPDRRRIRAEIID